MSYLPPLGKLLPPLEVLVCGQIRSCPSRVIASEWAAIRLRFLRRLLSISADLFDVSASIARCLYSARPAFWTPCSHLQPPSHAVSVSRRVACLLRWRRLSSGVCIYARSIMLSLCPLPSHCIPRYPPRSRVLWTASRLPRPAPCT